MNQQKHHHHHSTDQHSRPHPLTQFFGCCLGDEPTPLSPKIQKIREQLNDSSVEEIAANSATLKITSDMIVGDILINFPHTRTYLEDLHPLALLSPQLNSITLEMFFSDQKVDLEKICQDLSDLISVKPITS
ncbi:hypothetical protein IT411_01405 [Candidatus Peregrinibacteria bacterium]|nr:hypothetical protein [Candidatus Peregrinibacteria bacterium]